MVESNDESDSTTGRIEEQSAEKTIKVEYSRETWKARLEDRVKRIEEDPETWKAQLEERIKKIEQDPEAWEADHKKRYSQSTPQNNIESKSHSHKYKGSYVDRQIKMMEEDEEWYKNSRIYSQYNNNNDDSIEGPESPQGPTAKSDDKEVIMEIDEDVEALLRGRITKEEFHHRIEKRDEREVEQNVHYVDLDDE